MADGWSLPECMITGDHHWFGGTCVACGTQFRCGCGRWLHVESLASHLQDSCPQTLGIDGCTRSGWRPSLVDLGEGTTDGE